MVDRLKSENKIITRFIGEGVHRMKQRVYKNSVFSLLLPRSFFLATPTVTRQRFSCAARCRCNLKRLLIYGKHTPETAASGNSLFLDLPTARTFVQFPSPTYPC